MKNNKKIGVYNQTIYRGFLLRCFLYLIWGRGFFLLCYSKIELNLKYSEMISAENLVI